jgi:sigma-E factor negative regulatory protein RseA
MHADEMDRRERISALADGQLGDAELAQTMDWVASSEEARLTWLAYHVMGDALRSSDLADCSGDRDFVLRLRERLVRVDAGGELASVASVAADPAVRSANDAAQRWKWLAVAASVVAVAVLGWHVGSVGTEPSTRLAGLPTAAQPAQAGDVVANAAANAEPPVMLRDPRLDELLAAHRQFGGTSALQMASGFLRNATFEQPGR